MAQSDNLFGLYRAITLARSKTHVVVSWTPTSEKPSLAIDRLGMPIVSAGQFAYVFKLNKANGGESLAVRCFRSFAEERDKRYRAVDEHLDQHSLATLASFEYESTGFRVNGNLYPVLVMEWVDDPILDVYLDQVLGR